MKYILTMAAVFLMANFSFSQNVTGAQKTIDTLCSSYFSGRGYVNDGDIRASTYIANRYKSIGIKPLNSTNYYHDFSLNVNTFPTIVKVESSDQAIKAGKDFIVAPNCRSINIANLTVRFVDKALLLDKKRFKKLLKLDWSQNVLLLDTLVHDKLSQKRFNKLLKKYENQVFLEVKKKLTWSVSRDQSDKVNLYFLPGVLTDLQKISIHVEAKLVQGYEARNVVGYIPGTEQPDSFIFITGHYDHLGMMGQDCIMPGANDNASGIAMILDFAEYYKKNPPRYSIVFIAFAAEEAGLVGSYFFVNELSTYAPNLDARKIRFVVNMDLMGSGQEGIMAVNGAILPEEYALLAAINTENNYLPQTKKRGKAANSDHYFFTEAGIPAFFFYLMGPYNHYHDVHDTAENMRLEAVDYNGAFMLIRDFMNALMNDETN